MSVWFTIPSARPAGGTSARWRAKGYRIALCRDQHDECESLFGDDLVIVQPYRGYPAAVNALVKAVFAIDPDCQWCVAGGDDTDPDPRDPNEIAIECTAHFGGTFGVMQPTGDRWADGSIDRICGSPWMGREFCRRMNGGEGPFWPGYRHMFVDEELQEVAVRLGVLWQRRDITHRHEHFCRDGESVDWGRGRQQMPTFLREANSPEHWRKYQAMFAERKAAGFPGHEPIE